MDTRKAVLRIKRGRRLEYRTIVVPTEAEQGRIAASLHAAGTSVLTEVLGWRVLYRPPGTVRYTRRIYYPFAQEQSLPAGPPEMLESEIAAECTFGYEQDWSVKYSWRNGSDRPPELVSASGDLLPEGAVVIQESLLDWKPSFSPSTPESSQFGDAPEEQSGILIEGGQLHVEIDAVERNPEARRQCIAHYGARCFVCGFDFADFYGDTAAAGFIHVHHLIPLSTAGGERLVDPIRDLRPLCPNCHCFVHLTAPPREMDDAKSLVAKRRLT